MENVTYQAIRMIYSLSEEDIQDKDIHPSNGHWLANNIDHFCQHLLMYHITNYTLIILAWEYMFCIN